MECHGTQFAKLYFYRGLADPEVLDTSELKFGHDITSVLTAYIIVNKLLHLSWLRIVDLDNENPVYLLESNKTICFS